MVIRICLLALGYFLWFNHSLTFENPWHVFISFVAGTFLVPLTIEVALRTVEPLRARGLKRQYLKRSK